MLLIDKFNGNQDLKNYCDIHLVRESSLLRTSLEFIQRGTPYPEVGKFKPSSISTFFIVFEAIVQNFWKTLWLLVSDSATRSSWVSAIFETQWSVGRIFKRTLNFQNVLFCVLDLSEVIVIHSVFVFFEEFCLQRD